MLLLHSITQGHPMQKQSATLLLLLLGKYNFNKYSREATVLVRPLFVTFTGAPATWDTISRCTLKKATNIVTWEMDFNNLKIIWMTSKVEPSTLRPS